jgi:hypothetical protein
MEIRERHMVAEMLTVLENALFGLRLDQYLRHPVNDCWLSVCERWVGSETFMRHYGELHKEFSTELHQLIEQMRAKRCPTQKCTSGDGEAGSDGNAQTAVTVPR